MMNRRLFGLAVAAVVLLSSCSNFFTTSWGKSSARDPGTIKVTSSNVKDLLKESKGDTKTSRGILSKIKDQVAGKENPDPTLQTAAVTAANQASGLGTVVLDSIDTILGDDVPTEEALNQLLAEVQNKTKGNDLQGIAADVAASLPKPTADSEGALVFPDSFYDSTSEADLTLLTLTLVLAESEGYGDFDTYIETWTDGTRDLSDSTGILTPSERIIAAAANGIIKKKGGTLGDMLNGLFKG
jgi:hypothetical protein